jgi:hypothetical protein
MTTRATIIRTKIDKIIEPLPIGTTVNSPELAARLNTNYRPVCARTVGLMIRERPDMKFVSRCVWEKVGV